jgi:hypothetical protein
VNLPELPKSPTIPGKVFACSEEGCTFDAPNLPTLMAHVRMHDRRLTDAERQPVDIHDREAS